MKTAIGKKKGMTQIFDNDGTVCPVTLIELFPQQVIGTRTKEKDGYDALRFGFGVQDEKRVNKAHKGQTGGKAFKGIREVHCEKPEESKVGEAFGTADSFTVGDMVTIRGVSKGKGFAGVVKRHGFAGAPKTHGTKHTHRAPGSIGGGLRTRVPKGMRMAGHMGMKKVCIKGTPVMFIDQPSNMLFVKGSIPGARESIVEIQSL